LPHSRPLNLKYAFQFPHYRPAFTVVLVAALTVLRVIQFPHYRPALTVVLVALLVLVAPPRTQEHPPLSSPAVSRRHPSSLTMKVKYV